MNSAGLKRVSIALGLLAAIACPIMVHTIDLPAAIYARNDLPKSVLQVARLADNVDDYITITFVALALFAWFKLRNKALFRTLLLPPVSSLVAGTLNNMLKILFGRWRPKGYFNLHEYGFEFLAPFKAIQNSFPSGHSSSIMAIMTAMALLFPRWRIPFLAFACGMGSIRVVVGAHYPADVVGGLILGYLSTRWFHYLLARKNVLDADPRITLEDWRPRSSFTQK
ncbi:MAG: phosphatase PAP2 family protein [Kiritimatiellales bacterium]|nr:phosphatase PAP2 family protein [Kiritimatiellales bacterium]MCF7864507.1 phosphatase PAP2 family protein [Kiritimatiellales bacterium]